MVMQVPGSVRSMLSLALATALLAVGLPFIPGPVTRAATAVTLPFPEGRAVRIIQGYNGGSHQGRSRYALDLVLAAGGTSGAEVVSPIEGSVAWAQGPGAANGCMAIEFRDGSYSVVLCHVLFDHAYRPGESIARGQTLGTVGPAGSVGNNGAPHVHLELHRGRGANSPVPFSPPEGLSLEGVDLPASGAPGGHAGRTPIVSTTHSAGRAEPAAPEGRPRTVSDVAQARPAPQAAAPSPASNERALAARAGQSAQAPALTRAAVVHGTESCLNVRERASAEARIVECLPEGTEVPLVSATQGPEDGWRQIEARGWAASEYLKRTRAVISGTEGCLNVRERPTTGAAAVGCLAEGTSVTLAEGPVAGDAFDWYRIERAQPLEKGGWIVGQYLD